MITTEVKVSTDIQQFIEKFKPNKFKLVAKGVEIRGIIDLHIAINEAKEIINKFRLNLVVCHTAEMLTFRGFEVNQL